MGKKFYTDEMIQFLRDNCHGQTQKGIVAAFNEHFGTNQSLYSINGIRTKYHILLDSDGRFEKGHKVWNEGKHMSEETYNKVKPTMFKKGHNLNGKPIGSVYLEGDGHLFIKTSEKPKSRWYNWKLLSHLMYEYYYGEKLKDDEVIIFKDDNKLNFQKDNLMKIKLSENLVMNRHGLRFKGDLADTGLAIARLKMKTNELRKEEKEIKKNVD